MDHSPIPHADCTLSLSARDAAQVAEVVAAITRVAALPGWAAHVAEGALPDFGTAGALMGFDFHLTPRGPQLIEVNTNAGGALLADRHGPSDRLREALGATFAGEWAAQRGARPLTRLALVDDTPEGQFLYPEFLAFVDLFRSFGWAAEVVDPRQLARRQGALWVDDRRVDLVYNRLTDFSLAEPAHQALAEAWRAGEVVLTPSPRHHALLADKSLLARFSDADALAQVGAAPADIACLTRHVPPTVPVTPARADALWAERRGYFFKPTAGYASRGAYRGDKLTTAKWSEILASGVPYVAQRWTPPPEIDLPGVGPLKWDLRAIAWRGAVQGHFARVYQGQTTNLRTPGGGFAPVVVTPSADLSATATVTRTEACADS